MSVSKELIELLRKETKVTFYIPLDTETNRDRTNTGLPFQLPGRGKFIFSINGDVKTARYGIFHLSYPAREPFYQTLQNTLLNNSNELIFVNEYPMEYVPDYIDITDEENYFAIEANPLIPDHVLNVSLLNMKIALSVTLDKSFPPEVIDTLLEPLQQRVPQFQPKRSRKKKS